MSNQNYPYPEDEFDTLGANRVPQGVHREPVPRWRQWLPYVLVLILVPALTFVGVKYFFSGSQTPTPDSSPETTQTETVGPEESPTVGEEPTAGEEQPSEEPTEPEAPVLDQSVSVLVLNGANVQGLAGRVATLLGTDGWTNVTADNYTAETPAVSTIFYTSPDFEAEADSVGEKLGITSIVEDAASATNGVVVVLRPGFTEPTP